MFLSRPTLHRSSLGREVIRDTELSRYYKRALAGSKGLEKSELVEYRTQRTE